MSRLMISAVVALFVVFAGTAAQAQIVPLPQKWESGSEVLELGSTDLSYYFVDKPNPSNIFALNQLILFWEANQALRLTTGTRGKSDLLVGKLGNYDKLDEAFAQEDIERIGEEGYLINITSERIFLAAHTDAGLFYAIQTLRQYLIPFKDRKIPTLYLADWPDFSIRAWEDDMRSKGSPDKDYIKDEIKKMSLFKLNAMILSMETALPKNVVDELNRHAGLYHVKLYFNERPEGEISEMTISAENKIWPDLRGMSFRIREAVGTAAQGGATGFVLKTDDTDYFGFFESFYWPIVWGGVQLWNVEKSAKDDYLPIFNREYSGLYFSSNAPIADIFLDFSNLGQLNGLNNHSFAKSWEAYEGGEVGLPPESLEKLIAAMEGFRSRTREYLMQVSQNVYTYDCFQFAVNWSNWMVKKQQIQLHISNMQAGKPLPEDFNDQVNELRRELFALRQTYQTLWKKERSEKGLNADLKFFDEQTEATINLPYQVFASIEAVDADSLYAVGLQAINDTLPIYYTLDESEPTEVSLRYESVLQLPQNAVIKARTVSNRYRGPVAIIRVR